MSSVSSAAASALASSVLPTPAGPSTRIGLPILVARKTTGAMRRAQNVRCSVSRDWTSSIPSNTRSGFHERAGGQLALADARDRRADAAVGRPAVQRRAQLRVHGVEGAVAQDLLARLERDHARVGRRADVV